MSNNVAFVNFLGKLSNKFRLWFMLLCATHDDFHGPKVFYHIITSLGQNINPLAYLPICLSCYTSNNKKLQKMQGNCNFGQFLASFTQWLNQCLVLQKHKIHHCIFPICFIHNDIQKSIQPVVKCIVIAILKHLLPLWPNQCLIFQFLKCIIQIADNQYVRQ